MKRPHTVQSIERCFHVLEAVARSKEGVGVIDLAGQIDLPASTVHRLLGTLMNEGCIRQDQLSSRYHIGLRVLELAREALDNQSLLNTALPYLKDLRDKTGETSHLVVLDDENAVCIGSVESSASMRMCSPLGGKNPLHCTSVGKVLLAHLPDEKQALCLTRELKKYTRNTITAPEKLRAHLKKVRDDGFATDDEEFELGVRCVAAPILNNKRGILAAVGISGPSIRVDRRRKEDFRRLVVDTARKIAEAYIAV